MKNFIDLFSGIGGFRIGMENAGFKCKAFCEIDKFARKTYKSNFDTKEEIEWHDITSVADEEIVKFASNNKIDVICGGFPCQSFSLAGKRRGFKDVRGTMFFEIARFARIIKPKYLFLENVKGLLNHEKGETFRAILLVLDELGYDVEWQVLNSKYFGVPQNRERVFVVGHLRGECTRQVFPITGASEYYIRKYKEINKNDLCTITLTKPRGAGSTKQYYIKEFNKNISSCLASRDYKGLREGMTCVMENKDNNIRIRRLTPLEYFRLQGFSDDFYYNAKNNGVSDTQLYKQAGNSVTVNVIKEIAKRL